MSAKFEIIAECCMHKRIKNPFTLELAPTFSAFCTHPLAKTFRYCTEGHCPSMQLEKESMLVVKSIWED